MSKISDKNAVKTVVVGNSNVGKTCLLMRYCTKKFPDEYVPLIFDDHGVSAYSHPRRNIWMYDTGGGEDYHRLRPLSYPGTGIFTLCFSVVDRRSFKSINELWVPELRHHCPNAPILLVGTKIDLRSESDESKTYPDVELPITTAEGQGLASSLGLLQYVECSSLTGEGVDNVFEQVVEFGITEKEIEKHEKRRKCSVI